MRKKFLTPLRQKLDKYREQIIDLYVKQEKSCQDIANVIGFTEIQIWHYLKYIDVKIRGRYCKNKLPIDDKFFEIIDSDEKAYWLGWLWSDGHLSKDGYTISIRLKGSDIEVLEGFKKSIKSQHKIYIINQGEKSYGKGLKCCGIHITNKKIWNDLIKLNMQPSQSLIAKFPFIDERYLFAFIRGFIEGDGWISMYKTKAGYTSFEIGLIGTKNFLTTLIELLKKHGFFFNVFKTKTRTPGVEMFNIHNANKNEIVNFLDRVYENHNNLFLTRKYEKYLKMKEYLIENPTRTKGHIPKKSPDKMNFRW